MLVHINSSPSSWLKHLWSYLSQTVTQRDSYEEGLGSIREMKESAALEALKIFGYNGARSDMKAIVAVRA